MAFTPVEEVQTILSVVSWGTAEREARDSFREEWVEEPGITMPTVDLEVVEALMEEEVVREEAEATLEEAVEIMSLTPAGEGEDRTMRVEINRMNAVIEQLVMVK